MLEKEEKSKFLRFTFFEIMISFLDIFGVLLFGFAGTLALGEKRVINRADAFINFVQNKFNLEISINNLIVISLVFALIFFIFKNLISMLIRFRIFLFLGKVQSRIASYLTDLFTMQQISRIQSLPSQSYLHAMTYSIYQALPLSLGYTAILISEIFLLLVMTIVIFSYNFAIAIICFLFLSLTTYYFQNTLKKRLKYIGNMLTEISVKNAAYLQEYIYGMKEIRVSGNDHRFIGRLKENWISSGKLRSKQLFLLQIVKPVYETAFIFLMILIILFELRSNDFQDVLVTMSFLVALMFRILPSVMKINSLSLSIRSGVSESKNLFEIAEKLDFYGYKNFIAPSLPLNQQFVPKFVVSNLFFNHFNSKSIIKDLSFTILPQEKVAIIGESGIGKTTLIDLLLGILKPIDGQILLSDLDPAISISIFPHKIFYVSQQPLLINGSILKNIIFDNKDFDIYNSKRIQEILIDVGLLEFIESLPDGLNTNVGESGDFLSGGQRQRICIARALYSDAKIIILDEITNALDTVSSNDIMSLLTERSPHLTLIVLTHDLSHLKYFSKIIYLGNNNEFGVGRLDEIRNKIPILNSELDSKSL
jgi:ABC-type multidrug transport system fused ATPase/permease subunit